MTVVMSALFGSLVRSLRRSVGRSFVRAVARSISSVHLLLIEDAGNCTHSSINYVGLQQLVVHFIPEFALTDLKVFGKKINPGISTEYTNTVNRG